MSALLTREQILAAKDIKFEDVEVKEWGGTVRVRTMTAIERDAFLGDVVDSKGVVDRRRHRALLVARTAVGEDGAPLFTEADVAALGAKSSLALERVVTASDRINTLDESTVEAAVKNSGRGPSDASSAAGH